MRKVACSQALLDWAGRNLLSLCHETQVITVGKLCTYHLKREETGPITHYVTENYRNEHTTRIVFVNSGTVWELKGRIE